MAGIRSLLARWLGGARAPKVVVVIATKGVLTLRDSKVGTTTVADSKRGTMTVVDS